MCQWLKELKSKPGGLDLSRRDLDRDLDGFQKLVSTLRTFSISISICLDVETTRLTKITTDQKSFQQVAISQKLEILRTNLRRGKKFNYNQFASNMM